MNLYYGYIVAHTIGLLRNWIVKLPLCGYFWKICSAFQTLFIAPPSMPVYLRDQLISLQSSKSIANHEQRDTCL